MSELIEHLKEIKDFRISMVLLGLLIILTKFSWNHYQKILQEQKEKDDQEKKELKELIDKMYGVVNNNHLKSHDLVNGMYELRQVINDLKNDIKKN